MAWILVLFLISINSLCFAQELMMPGLGVPSVANMSGLGLPPLPGLAKLNNLISNPLTAPVPVPCTCGVFLTSQFTPGSNQPPRGDPVLLQEHEFPFPCTTIGQKQCANKCLEVIAKHLRNSATIVCGSLDRDCFKERAYLWTKNCDDVWHNSHMSAGRQFCCKDGVPYNCPP